MDLDFELDKDQYGIKFVFNINNFKSESDLKDRVKKIICQTDCNLSPQFKKRETEAMEMILEASKSNIDSCHQKIISEFKAEYFIRLKDELGEELREKLYPVVAEIEQRFREFIQHVCIEAKGVGWWEELAPPKFVDKLKDISNKREENNCHPLKLTSFQQLVSLTELSHWSSKSTITADKISQLLSESSTFSDFKENFRSKTNNNMWDRVLYRYFKDEKSWQDLKGIIEKNVIPARNKIAHHRAFFQYEAQELYEKKNSVIETLNNAIEKELSPDNIEEAQKEEIFTPFVKGLAGTAIQNTYSQAHSTVTMAGPIPANKGELESYNLEPKPGAFKKEDEEDEPWFNT